jgi:hypothetical protein
MLRTLNKDTTDSEYQIFGAQSKSSNSDCASLVLGNYDDDTKLSYRLGEICVRDHYGNAASNGFGNLYFRTNGEGNTGALTNDRMCIMHNGNIGFGTVTPATKCDVAGTLRTQNIQIIGNSNKPINNLIAMTSLIPTILDGADVATVAPVYADASPPVSDSNVDAWRFVNDVASKKINWYFSYNSSNTNTYYKYKNLRTMYYKVRFNSVPTINTLPYIAIYDHTLGDGKDAAVWYRHRMNFLDFSESNFVTGKDYVFFVGNNPINDGFLNLVDENMVPVLYNSNIYGSYTGNSNEDRIQDSNVLKFIALNTSSSANVNSVDFTLSEFGYRIGSKITRYATSFSSI